MIKYIIGVFTAIIATLSISWKRSANKIKNMKKEQQNQQNEVKKTNERIIKDAMEIAKQPTDHDEIDNEIKTAIDSGNYDDPFNGPILRDDENR